MNYNCYKLDISDVEDVLNSTNADDNVMVFVNEPDGEYYLKPSDYSKLNSTQQSKCSPVTIGDAAIEATGGTNPIIKPRPIRTP